MDSSPISIVAVGSLAVKKVVDGLYFLLSMKKSWHPIFPEPDFISEPLQKAAAKKTKEWQRFVLAVIFTVPVLAYAQTGIFSLMGFQKMPPVLDYILSSFLMGAGAGVWEQALRTHEDSMLAKSGEGTIQLVGSLTVDDGEKGSPEAKCPSCGAVLGTNSSYCSQCGTRVAASAGAA